MKFHMQGTSTNEFLILAISFAIAVIALIVYGLFGHAVVIYLYGSGSGVFEGRAEHGVGRYFQYADFLFYRILALFILSAVLFSYRRMLLSALRQFLSEETHPLNLAMFRIAVFTSLIGLSFFYHVEWFAAFPANFRLFPAGFKSIAPYIPFTTGTVYGANRLFLLFCVTAVLGLFTRFSAFMATALGLYVLFIPECFGKVSHYHHVLWFSALLVPSRAGDFLSIDAIFKSFKRSDRGIPQPGKPCRAYALPIRLAWLLMGVVYFFPGFWKIWTQGFDWFLSENLKLQIYAKWLDWEGWMPAFRIDQYPLLYKGSALATVFFELSFIFLAISPRLRPLAFLGGIAFHLLTYFFIRISFWYLLVFYLTFLDWNAIFRFLGRIFVPRVMYLIYDGQCRLCKRTVAAVRTFDLFGRVDYIDLFNEDALRARGLGGMDRTALARDIHAVVGEKSRRGFDAYRALSKRIPLLWPILPFLYVWPVPAIGDQFYRHVADTRSCDVNEGSRYFATHSSPRMRGSSTSNDTAQTASDPGVRRLMGMGVFLLVSAALFGVLKIHSWPFAVYPTFDQSLEKTREVIEIDAFDADGQLISYEDFQLKERIYFTRLRLMHLYLLGMKDIEQRNSRLKALWEVWRANIPSLASARKVRFFRATHSLLPENFPKNPLARELIFEWDLISFESQIFR
ncbi:MAG: DUF393 domain-containing protein [Candidatus Omnitrophica bacterium]|nr:DUF393 domain-containing protein [Candidatus Omnitrophota bacterium]